MYFKRYACTSTSILGALYREVIMKGMEQLITVFIAECLSMRHIILRGRRVPTIEYAVCIFIYLFNYLFKGLSGSIR